MERLILRLLLLCLLAGCASLPDVGYLRDRHAPAAGPPTILGAHGPLPEAKRQALLERLEKNAGRTDILARHIAAEDAINGTPLTAGNSVTLLDDGPATMRAILAAVRAAHDNINLETYIFEDDEVGRELADMLIAKHAAGVAVHLIYDSVGTLDTPSAFFDRMRAAGIETLEYNPVNPLRARGNWDPNQRDHRKLLVVDGRLAFTGGVNISKVYGRSSFPGFPQHHAREPENADDAAWRDTEVRIEGPAVAEFQSLFADTWRRGTGEALAGERYFPQLAREGSALVRAIGSSPARADFTVYKTYVSAFANADRYAHVTIAYFVPDKQILHAMIDAAHRGVDVKIIFPSFSDVSLVLYAGRSFYEEMLEAGIHVYERRSALLHAKTAVVDGVWSTIGSTNLDIRSFLHNEEINAVILDTGFAHQMETLFERDLGESEEITLARWHRRGLAERLREAAGRALSYWL